MEVFITGDTHGNFRRFLPEFFYEQEWLNKEDILLIAGDFGGVWYGDDRDSNGLDFPLFLERFQTLNAQGAPFRVNHRSWWKEELPSEAEYREARTNLEKAGWAVDYIIPHCAPTIIQNALLREFSTPDALTDSLEEVCRQCRFKYHFFGHCHSNLVLQQKYVLLYEQILRLK